MEITQLLGRLQEGDPEALGTVMPLVYEELKKLARSHLRRESRPGALQPTALVHEAFLKLAGSRHPAYENRSHFYGIASRLMRQVLVDTARSMAASKRSAAQVVPLAKAGDWGPRADRSVLAVHDALRGLEATDPVKGRLIEMRYFGGMTAEECSEALEMPVPIVRRELRLAQAWLRKEMAGRNSGPAANDTPALT